MRRARRTLRTASASSSWAPAAPASTHLVLRAEQRGPQCADPRCHPDDPAREFLRLELRARRGDVHRLRDDDLPWPAGHHPTGDHRGVQRRAVLGRLVQQHGAGDPRRRPTTAGGSGVDKTYYTTDGARRRPRARSTPGPCRGQYFDLKYFSVDKTRERRAGEVAADPDRLGGTSTTMSCNNTSCAGVLPGR